MLLKIKWLGMQTEGYLGIKKAVQTQDADCYRLFYVKYTNESSFDNSFGREISKWNEISMKNSSLSPIQT